VGIAWVRRYDGPPSGVDVPVALALDSSGYVCVTGWSDGLGTGSDYATVAYGPSGEEKWTARFHRPSGGMVQWDHPKAVALDHLGNAVVTGYSYTNVWGNDYATVKYSPAGEQLWVAIWNQSTDKASAIAVDDSGNCFVTGTAGGLQYANYATIKYDPEGQEVWGALYDGPANSEDEAHALALGDSGCVYVAGHSRDPDTDLDYATVKYSSEGTELWATRYNGPHDSTDVPTVLAVDGLGRVYVTGYSYARECSYDYTTIRYDPDGRESWVARYDGPAGDQDQATALAVDTAGCVYVTGYSVGTGTGEDYATVKYGPDGLALWVARYDGGFNGFDAATAVAVDDSGNVYVSGYSDGGVTDMDCATIKYDPQGTELWVARYDSPHHGADWASAMAIDDRGGIYITGRSMGTGTYLDYLTIKYAPGASTCEPSNETDPPHPQTSTFGLCRGLLVIPTPQYSTRQVRYDLLDVAGRTALQLAPGPNDVGHLSAGVYYVRITSGTQSDVRKLLVVD